MLVSDQINEIHRLHLIEKWSLRRIARHLHIGRHTLAKYVATPAPAAASRKRTSKLDPYKAALAELLQQDSSAAASDFCSFSMRARRSRSSASLAAPGAACAPSDTASRMKTKSR